jgi:hypothetical protein
MATQTPNPICCAGAFHSPMHLLADIKYNNSYQPSMAQILKDKFSLPKWGYRKFNFSNFEIKKIVN